MCIVTVRSDQLEDYFNDECEVEISAFSWSQYDRNPSFDSEIKCGDDLILEMDDYIKIDEYNDVCDQLEICNARLETVLDEYEALNTEMDLLKKQLVLAQGSKPWYKF